jgi:hypothetical protein
MNRTYFGDTRDLFKFDLVRHIMKSLPELASFTFVPMLTESEENGGKKKSTKKDLGRALKAGKPGSQNRDLLAHMERLQEIEDDLEYFSTIRTYFRNENILIDIFDRQRFTHEKRDHYFQSVFEALPKKSLIFLDPDTGLEERQPTAKHLLMTEVKKIYHRMDAGSVMMIYQHFPRVPRDRYVKHRCEQLAELTGSDPVTITDNEIIFFLLAKNPKTRSRLELVLERYANTYPALNSPAYG